MQSELALNIPHVHGWKETIIGTVIKQTKSCNVSITDTFGQCSLYLHLSRKRLTFQLSSLFSTQSRAKIRCLNAVNIYTSRGRICGLNFNKQKMAGASLMLLASCWALRHLRTGTSVQYWTADCFEAQSVVFPRTRFGLPFRQHDRLLGNMIGAVHCPKGEVHPLLLTGRVLQ